MLSVSSESPCAGEVVGEALHLDLGAHDLGDELDPLAHRVLDLVAAVVDLPGGPLGLVDGQQHAVGQVGGVAPGHEVLAAVGDDHERPPVEDPADHRPLPRRDLVGPVHVGIAEVRRGRVGREHLLLGLADQVGEAVVGLAGDGWRPRGPARSCPAATARRGRRSPCRPGSRRPTRSARSCPRSARRGGGCARRWPRRRRRCGRRAPPRSSRGSADRRGCARPRAGSRGSRACPGGRS